MQIIYLDISNKGVIPCIQAKQNEVGRKFIAVITDNGQPYMLSNDSLLSVWYEGDTDAGNYSSIENRSAFTIHRNNVTVELVAQMLLSPGKGELCLSISKGDGTETNTWNIPYEVEYKPGATSTIPTEYYTALTEAGSLAASAVGEAKDAADEAKTAAQEAESAANSFSTSMANLLNKVIPVGYIFQWDSVWYNKNYLDSELRKYGLSISQLITNLSAVGVTEQEFYIALDTCGANGERFAENIWAAADKEAVDQEISDAYVLENEQYQSIFDSVVALGGVPDLSTAEKVSAHFGIGTWEQVKDTFLLACGDIHTAGETGGEETHTMTVDEMPSHNHGLYRVTGELATGSTWARFSSGGTTDNDAIKSTGGGQPFNIMPPYRSIYVWKRIS